VCQQILGEVVDFIPAFSAENAALKELLDRVIAKNSKIKRAPFL